jgi:hypothetical protein
MSVPIPIALGDIRAAILKMRRMTFIYEKEQLVADFYLLGHARKTGAYVIIAWCVAPVQGWRLLRYALMKDLEPMGMNDGLRADFSPHHAKIATVDTLAFMPARKAAH